MDTFAAGLACVRCGARYPLAARAACEACLTGLDAPSIEDSSLSQTLADAGFPLVPGVSCVNNPPNNKAATADYLRFVLGYDRFFFFRPLNPSNSFTLVAAFQGQVNLSAVNGPDYRNPNAKPGHPQVRQADPANPLSTFTDPHDFEDQYVFEGFAQVALQTDYLPATLTSKDYPNLIPEGGRVDTIAVPAVLAAYNWAPNTDRYRKLSQFVDAFFTKFPEIQKPPRHPRWKNVNLAATMEGWTRFQPAQEWLDRLAAGSRQFRTTTGSTAPTAGANPKMNEALFKEFLEWRRKRGSN